MAIDLHVHSNCSDGSFSPKELVDYAIEKGLSAFALTDHDTIDGLTEAISYSESLRKQGLFAPEIVPGIEFSTEYHGKDIHIIGLYIRHQKPGFTDRLKSFLDSRILRNRKMCTLLQEADIDITYEKLLEQFPGAVITRAHYARYLLNNGYVKSMSEAFDRYIGDHAPCFVPREKVSPVQAVQLILEADGIPILAHPILYHFSNEHLDVLTAELKEAGLMGIEAVYATYNHREESLIRRLAAKHRLLISGGSDFHGSNKPGLDLGCGYGRLYLPDSILADLKKSLGNLLFTDMDGTLLNNHSEISPAMKAALDQMTSRGHHLILSSGRPLPSILEVRKQQGITYSNMLIISNNGALVYDCDSASTILEHRIAPEDISYLVHAAEERGLHIHGYTDTHIVCHKLNPELTYYTRRIHMPLQCVEDIPAALPEGSYKLQAIHLTDRSILEDFRDSVADYCEGRIQLIFSNNEYLEILPIEAGKGSALRFVESYLPAPHSHSFAAGDAENDISMLEAAYTGIAMANAHPEVKKAAAIITRADNDHDGLLEILQDYFT